MNIMAPVRSRPRSARPPVPAAVIALALTLALGLASAASCRLSRLERRLGPRDADFYSKVHIIMTREERKIFLELPEAERESFIDEFWKRRDPDPETPDNPFKTEYESRVERARQLFGGEGRPGYLTDRGRIYLLFGPPMERLTYPMDASGYCREVWYYGAFPVIFIDERCEGQFILTAVNLEHLEKLNIAQGHFQKTIVQDKEFFDYSVTVLKDRAGGPAPGGTVVIEVPFAVLWFDVKDGGLETSLDVRLEARTAAGDRLWEFRRAYVLALGEDELKTKKGLSYRIEIPMVLAGDAGGAGAGKLTLHVALKNGADGEELKKALELR
jgi:GWxTD domain-containing protein